MESKLVRQLAGAGHLAPSADNSQPWHLHWNGSSLDILYDKARVTGKTFPPDSPGTLLSIGALIENVLAVAEACGAGPVPHIEQSPGTGNPARYASISFDHSPSAAIGDAIREAGARHTNRGKYTTDPISSTLATELVETCQGKARAWFTQDADVRKQVTRAVNQASQIRFRTREVHEWLGKSLRFSAESVSQGDGLDIATLGLPPGGGYFLRLISDWNRLRWLNKLGMYKLLASIDSAPVGAGPGLLAIIAPGDACSTMEAGRLMERLWTRINTESLAVQPYYVVPDQLSRLSAGHIPQQLTPIARILENQSRALFGLRDEETLHMLLRVGVPCKTAKRSLRLPLGQVYFDNGG